MYKREVPKLTKEIISSCQDQMKLHLSGIGDNVKHRLENEYTTPIGPLIVEKMNEKRNHNNPMIEIVYFLNDAKFNDKKIVLMLKICGIH